MINGQMVQMLMIILLLTQLKYSMGMSVGIGKDATIEARSHLYNSTLDQIDAVAT